MAEACAMKISSKQRQQITTSNVSTERTTRSSATPRSLRRSDLSVRRTETTELKRDIAVFKKQGNSIKKPNKFSVAGRQARTDSKRGSSSMSQDSETEVLPKEAVLSRNARTGESDLISSGSNGFLEESNITEDAAVADNFASGVFGSKLGDQRVAPFADITEIKEESNEFSVSDNDIADQKQQMLDSPSTVVQSGNRIFKRKGRRKRKFCFPKKRTKPLAGSQGNMGSYDMDSQEAVPQPLVESAEGAFHSGGTSKGYQGKKRDRIGIVKELHTSTGFVDKLELGTQPEELVPMKRKPRMASLNAIAKVNAVLESYSPLSGRSMTEIREKSQAKRPEPNFKPKEDKKRKRSTSSLTQTDDILFFSSMKGENNEWKFSGPGDVFKQPTVLYDDQPISDSRVSSTSNWASEDEATMTKDKAVQTIVNHKAVQTDVFLFDDAAATNSPSSCTCGYLENISTKEHTAVGPDSALHHEARAAMNSHVQATIYHTPPTVTTNTLNLPLCSSISTKTTTHTIAIPFTKTHLLAHTDIDEFQAFPNQALNPQSSKRMASLNAIAMMNAMKVLDRPLFGYSVGASSKGHDYEKSDKQSSIRIPKISYQATSTSRFSLGGKGKVQNPVKAAQIRSLSNQIESLTDGKKLSIRQSNKMINGWIFEGEPVEKPFALEDRIVIRRYYSSMRRNDEVINVRDAVLLKSGPRKKDLPFVARVAAIWEDDEGNLAGDMMMSVFWYYRPEQTEVGKMSGYHGELEVLASRHRDDNSAACVVDKCYVLSYPQYCRFRAKNKLYRESRRAPLSPVPPTESTRPGIIPPPNTDPNLVFFCRHVYDSRTGKILKNPFY